MKLLIILLLSLLHISATSFKPVAFLQSGSVDSVEDYYAYSDDDEATDENYYYSAGDYDDEDE